MDALLESPIATGGGKPSAVNGGIDSDNPLYHPHRPMPDPATGELKIDPDILLRAKQFNLAIDFVYSSQSDTDDEYGRARSASVHGYVNSSVSSGIATIVRGDFREYPFTQVGASGGITTYTALTATNAVTTLSFDGTKFTEYFNDGMQMVYQAQVGGGDPVKHQLTLVKDANGNAQTYVYGSGAEAGLLKTITVPGGNVATFIYAAGATVSLLNAVQDWGNRRWTFQYDANRYLTTITTPLGCTTKYTYSLAGSPVTMVNTIADPRGFVTSYMFDSSRRVASMAAGSAVWTWTYGTTHGRTVMTSPSGAVTTSNYDNTGNITSVNKPEGYTVSYTYNGNRIKLSEQVPAGTIYSVTYDQKLWLITASDDALGNRTTMQYDAFGNLTTLTDANAKVTTFGYEGTGSNHRRIRMSDPLGRVTAYSFTSDGQLKSVTDGRNLITTFNYDSFGNVASIVASDGGITTMQYDALNRMTTMVDAGGTTTYAYSDRSELIGQTLPGSLVLTMTYDSAGNRVTLVDPDGGRFTYVYDEVDRISTVRDPDANLTTFQYDVASRRTTLVDANGNTRKYQYDAANRLTTQIELNAAANPIITIVDAYDNVGNRTSRNKDGTRTTWTYDAGYRLVSQTLSGAHATFVYDKAGNTTVKWDEGTNPMSFTFDNANRIVTMLQGATLTTYTFDACGNETAENAAGSRATFSYDNENRLTTVVNADGTRSTYTYAGDGKRRTQQEPGGTLTTVVWDGDDYLQERA